MEWTQIPLGMLETNCYVIKNKDMSCLIVDPGGEGEKLIHALKGSKLTPIGIILTHAHWDHISAVDLVRDEYKIPVYIHENEKDWLFTPLYNGSTSREGEVILREADVTLNGDQEMKIGSFTFQLLQTPGHSPGSISLYFKDLGIVIVGDALFNGSIGRTDFYGGNYETLINSIQEKLLSLPEDTMVLSGHGPVTTIKKEKASNPFLRGL